MIASSGTNCHLYNYANNNPIKYTDPDGNETEDTADGKYIHTLITIRYQQQHKGEIVYGNKAMSSILYKLGLVDKGLGRTDLGLRPDIWNVTTNEMYEIKPATQGAAVAKDQLINYIVLAAKYGVANVKAGRSDVVGTSGEFMLNENTKVTYWSPSSGVILYSKKEFSQQQKNFYTDLELSPFTATILALLFMGLMTGIQGIPVPVGQ